MYCYNLLACEAQEEVSEDRAWPAHSLFDSNIVGAAMTLSERKASTAVRMGSFIFACDGCDKPFRVNVCSSMDGAVSVLRRTGWKVVREDGKWHHYCSESCEKLRNVIKKAQRGVK
jgi:ribosomal protein L24E